MKPETIALHGGSHRADPSTGSVAVPIHQTTSFQFQDTGHAARLFGLQELGNIYTRIMNPTCDALETRLAALEGGVAALAVGSGQAATTFCVMNLCAAGDNIVSSTDLYGGTWNLFANTLKQFGIEVRFVDPADPEAFARASDDRTRCCDGDTGRSGDGDWLLVIAVAGDSSPSLLIVVVVVADVRHVLDPDRVISTRDPPAAAPVDGAADVHPLSDRPHSSSFFSDNDICFQRRNA